MTMDQREPSRQVIQAVADAENAEPPNLPKPLWQAIDTEALDRLISSNQHTTKIQFEYMNYDVTVTTSGDVRLD